MKPFRFRLSAVRSLRERQEQQALDEYAKASLAHQRALGQLVIVQHQLEGAWAEVRRKLADGIEAPRLTQLQSYTCSLEARRKACETAVAQTLCALNQTQQKFAAARQQTEVMDRYFECQKSKHDRLMLAEEFKLLDDIAARQAAVPSEIGNDLKPTR